ncbi:sensor histidine kinase [Mammaliicoccus stepanovicii]|uniref:histidine kinase n=1 Tax=Mammaliicoccus stepanovicii TaxID=643214 RepID=A0A240A697_9STAP|nr:HAMP domain-containing sensor histidine kinase [Mammaliicoccus stepanovicii]PNZ79146.1 two-component sensor histidine kinase [Mammaliicoccus stepanovicii]GGI39539.1 histidine protein kinase SaeS [Mammaliicoccus stepanovicii]SNV78463.1 histidine protein kinase SaeS [Mammaliicoccus stepanovicii]
MLTIRVQIFIAFMSSIILTTAILGVAYKWMWFNAHTTLILTVSAIIASCLTTVVCMLFINPLVTRIRMMNNQTKLVAKGNYEQSEINIKSPKEMRELSESFNTMAKNITAQIEQVKYEQQEKIEMVQNLSHDLKTPLASITSYAEGLKDGVIADEESRKKAYDVLIKQSKRIDFMFDELTSVMTLDAISENKYELETIYIDKLFVSILQTYEQQLACESRKIDFNMCDNIQSFKQYRIPLERILMNIIDNAIKFTSVGTRIELKVNKVQDGMIAIAVSDEGPGISSEHLNRIFDRTYRVEESRNKDTGGSGLGLYIARNLAHQMDGTLEVESKKNIGTTFILNIPMK